MLKRSTSTIGILAVFALGAYLAWEASQLYLYRAVFAGSYKYNLLFTNYGWLIPIAVFLGIFVGAASIRKPAEIAGDKVLRHDETAFLIHWGHAVSCVVLLVTGVMLGFLFVPRLVGTPQMAGFMLNLHFVGVLVFMFSVSMHITDVYVGGKFKEHMPEAHDLEDAIAHYAAKLGLATPKKEGKFLASERLSYPMWIVSVGLVILTGVIKVSAHYWNLPGELMKVTTFLHDVAAILVLLNLMAHITMSTIVPWSWPLIKSMLFGWIPLDYVKHHHALWYEEITGEILTEPEPVVKKKKGRSKETVVES
ncbi:MAG: cytochrome b/b6 domain-containing protein [Limnochordia bacterium]|nr:cytochrome b/b6 domain-containing protein [Limnochordia bacterium]